MKKLAVIALVFAGLIVLTVWRLESKLPNLASTLPVVSPTPRTFNFAGSIPQEQPPVASDRTSWELNGLCTHDDSLAYGGFVISRAYDPRTHRAIVTIKKGRRLVARHRTEPSAWGVQSSCFGLTSVLGSKDKQLLVVQTSGGAHCCFSYYLYDFFPAFRRIFNGDMYPIGDGFDELKFANLDRDRAMEFTQQVITFDYCCGQSYAASPQPQMAFKYDRAAGQFLPTPWPFRRILLGRTREELEQFDADPLTEWPSLLHAVVQYIYAGERARGWRLYERGAVAFDKKLHSPAKTLVQRNDPTRRELEKLMRRDSIYRLIYSHDSTDGHQRR